jgi:hypothetical protein
MWANCRWSSSDCRVSAHRKRGRRSGGRVPTPRVSPAEEITAPIESFLAKLFAQIPAITTRSGSSADFVTKSLYFHFTSAVLQTWTAPFKGWVSGYAYSYSTGVGIGINAIPPAAAITVHGITQDLVLPPMNEGWQLSSVRPANVVRWPFNVGDVINVRPLVAGTGFVMLFLCQPDIAVS